MKEAEAKKLITDAGYSMEYLINSSGEHAGKYLGGHHAVCLGDPLCAPTKLGALYDREHAIAGFPSLPELIEFMNKSFPDHKAEAHLTKWAVPLD